MDTSSKRHDAIEAKLGLWDAVSIIVGIIIGVGIFDTPHGIFERVSHPAIAVGLWVLGGMLSLIGALCFAELASTYPRSGGEYVYLTRAFGPLTGFLFAWSQLSVTRSGSIAAMAYLFGKYAAALIGFDADSGMLYVLAAASVLLLTFVNVLGVRVGAGTQNVLTTAKVLGLTAIILVGFTWGRGDLAVPENPRAAGAGWFVVAMIFVLWTYSGWHEAAYIVSEAHNRTRNIPLALLIGTALVTVIYVAVNLAFVFALGFDGAQEKFATQRILDLVWPGYGARAMNVLIVVSSLGAINGMIFTTARIYSEFGRDHRVFRLLSHWSKRMKTPVRALAIQCVISTGMIVGVWLAGMGSDGFDSMVRLTVAVFWSFFCLTGVALIRLRTLDPDLHRPFRVPIYPLLPIIFSGWCFYIVAGAVADDVKNGRVESLVGVAILCVGLPLYFIPQKMRQRQPQQDLHAVSK